MSRVAVALAFPLLLLVPVPGRAAFHIAVIDEVMSGVNNGTVNDSNIQYVEIRMLSSGQDRVCHTRLTVFRCVANGGGFQVLVDDVGGAAAVNPCLPNSADGGRWIMASPDGATFLAASGITPDFTWSNSGGADIPASCGMVCWGAPGSVDPAPRPWDASDPFNYVDCVAYGPYDGTPQPLGNPPVSATPGGGTFSLTKVGSAADGNDYVPACPSPTSNPAQTMGSFGACTPPSPTTTTTLTATTSSTVTTTSFPPGAGQPIAGTKLLLKANPTKAAKKALVLVAKDAAIRLGDPTQLGGSLRVVTTAGDAFDTSYPLAASHWKPIGKPGAVKGYRFTDATGPIKSVVVKRARIAKAVGKGSGLGHTLAADPDPVTILLATGVQRYCMSFGGGKFVAGKKYLATHDPPPPACP